MSNTTDKKLFRAEIEVTLRCESNVHIGDGSNNAYEPQRATLLKDNDLEFSSNAGQSILAQSQIKPVEYQRCVNLGSEESPQMTLPGSALRYALRQGSKNTPNATLALFGQDQITEGQAEGGLVNVYNAQLIHNESDFDPRYISHWSEIRKTGLTTRIEIDNPSQTAKPKHLYYREFYPIGSVFRFKIVLIRPTQENIHQLIQTLNFFDGSTSNTLGAYSSKSWGQLQVTTVRKRQQSYQDVQDYLQSNNTELAMPEWECVKLEATQDKLNKGIFIPFNLVTQQPLLIADPSMTANAGDHADKVKHKESNRDETEFHDTITWHNGWHFGVPSESFYGVFKSTAKRIVNTLAYRQSKNYTESNELTQNITRWLGDQRHAAIQVVPWKIDWQDSLQCQHEKLHKQNFIALDGITQAVAQGCNYSVAAIPANSRLVGGGFLFKKTLTQTQLGLFALTLKVMSQNSIWLGGFKNKGYGLTDIDLDGNTIDQLLKDLQIKDDSIDQCIDTFLAEFEAARTDKPKTSEDFQPLWTRNDQREESEQVNSISNKESHIALNPYGLVSLKQFWQQNSSPDVATAINKGARHDLFDPQRYSGKLSCKLTLKSPTIVGNQHEPRSAKPTLIKQYQRNEQCLAIPANSLMGMVQNIINLISHSSLRHFNNATLSNRMIFSNKFEKQGRLLTHDKGKTWVVKPVERKGRKGNYTYTDCPVSDIEVSPSAIQIFQNIHQQQVNDAQETGPYKAVMPIDKAGTYTPYESGQLAECHSGNIVWYKTDESDSEVNQISGSQIWRKPISPDKQNIEQILSQTNKDLLSLLPYGHPNRPTGKLSPAELLFGVVPAANAETDQADLLSLASRVRFTDAYPKDGFIQQSKPIILPQRASPKVAPKSIDKNALGTSRRLPLRMNTTLTKSAENFETQHSNTDDKFTQVQPLMADQAGEFEVHFHNLDAAEMELLLIGLDPNLASKQTDEAAFYHKLGLFKAPAFGTTSITVSNVKLKSTHDLWQHTEHAAGDMLDKLQDKTGNQKYYNPATLTLLQQLGAELPDCWDKQSIDYLKDSKLLRLLKHTDETFLSSRYGYKRGSSIKADQWPTYTKSK